MTQPPSCEDVIMRDNRSLTPALTPETSPFTSTIMTEGPAAIILLHFWRLVNESELAAWA